eukprot:3791138-Rhodomonas_salina.4
MSVTDIAYSAVCLRACYAMSGTDIQRMGLQGTLLSIPTLMVPAYARPMRCPVLTQRMVLICLQSPELGVLYGARCTGWVVLGWDGLY